MGILSVQSREESSPRVISDSQMDGAADLALSIK